MYTILGFRIACIDSFPYTLDRASLALLLYRWVERDIMERRGDYLLLFFSCLLDEYCTEIGWKNGSKN